MGARDELDHWIAEDQNTRHALYQRQQSEIAIRRSGGDVTALKAARCITHVFDMADEATVRLARLDGKVDQLSRTNPALRYSLQRIEIVAALSAEQIIENYAR